MAPDLILYAIVAAGLVLWLRNVLGTRHGEERDRPNPFALQGEKAGPSRPVTENGQPLVSPQDKIAALVARPGAVMSVESKTAENGLLDIARIDKNFDIHAFLEGAQDAFVMIVEAFAKHDRATLKDLLEPSVFAAFDGAIGQREAAGETMATEILAVRKAQVVGAQADGRTAYVTVRFQADEIAITKDKEGAVIAGHAERVVPMRDIWTFVRDTRSKDPRWLLHETRGDFEGDNDIIPNTN